MLGAAGDTGSVAGHPLWHLAAVLAAPVMIIVAFKCYDRIRYNRIHRPPATRPLAPQGTAFPDAQLKLVALASAGAALVHGAVCPEHFRERTVLGLFFLVLCGVQLGWSAALLRRPSAALLRVGAVGSLMVVGLWLYTRTVGLPLGLEKGAVEQVGPPDLVASALEVLVAGLALRLSRARTWRRPQEALPA